MAGLFEYGQNLFLDAVLGRLASVTSTLQVGLLTDSPDNDDDTLDEPDTALGYSRVIVSNDSSFWSSANNGLKFSTRAVYFPTATDDWGLITHYAIFDASGFGIMWGQFNEPIYVAVDQAVVIDAGMLSASADAPETSIVL